MIYFQDKYNKDLERLQRCDIHYLTPDLRIVPFCAFNVIPDGIGMNSVLYNCRGMERARRC